MVMTDPIADMLTRIRNANRTTSTETSNGACIKIKSWIIDHEILGKTKVH